MSGPTTEQPEPPDESPHPPAAPDEPAPPPAPLLRLRDGLPVITETEDGLAEVVARVASGSGPIALDAERASGYRYSPRAYLIQLRREGSGTALIDPIAYDDLSSLNEAIGDAEWILHAASQDLPCLRELGLEPVALFDTELAARLLGYPRVGLATLVEVILGRSMRKEHSAVDWSRRPLPQPWLEYAALDVEVLVELRDVIAAELVESGKDAWAQEEFQHLIDHVPPPRQDPWRRTSGIHKAKGRRALAAVRELWIARDTIAEQRDTTPGRLIPDSALIAAANAMPTTTGALLDTDGFHGRGARRYSDEWLAALVRARDAAGQRATSAHHPLRRPTCATGLGRARPGGGCAPGHRARPGQRLRRGAQRPGREPVDSRLPEAGPVEAARARRLTDRPESAMEQAVSEELARLGARSWQVKVTAPMITRAILHPERASES